MNLQALNAVKNKIVKFANEKGIDLQAEFGTPDKFKNFVISLCLKTLIDAGATPQEALDAVLGEGTYESILTEVWNKAQQA
jgi:hypothetical protein